MNEKNDVTALFKFRKCSDIDLEYAFYEVLSADEKIFFDIGANYAGVIEVRFYPDGSALKLELSDLLQLIEKGRKLAAAEVGE